MRKYLQIFLQKRSKYFLFFKILVYNLDKKEELNMERLQKIISQRGYCSRRKAEQLIKEGKVSVDGKIIKDLGIKAEKNAQILIEGKVLTEDINYEYYLLNKPRQTISSSKDEKGRKTVTDIIKTNKRIYPIGRLDYDTTGLIILTNDGNLANILMHPSYNVEKTYVAKIEGILKISDLKSLKEGIIIDNYKTKKAKVKILSIDKKEKKSIVSITIHEGHNHQVKKMFSSLGYNVLKLKREKYAFLTLEGLKAGEYRKLTTKEVKKLYNLKTKKEYQ